MIHNALYLLFNVQAINTCLTSEGCDNCKFIIMLHNIGFQVCKVKSDLYDNAFFLGHKYADHILSQQGVSVRKL